MAQNRLKKTLDLLLRRLKDKNMGYFITEQQRKQIGSTCYFEFQKGSKKYKPVFWKEDSILLDMGVLDEIQLYKIIPHFNYYGITIIDKEKWIMIQKNAEKENENIKKAVSELAVWVEENFKEFDFFVIHGI